MLAKLAGDAHGEGSGSRTSYADHRARPLLEHVEDFERHILTGKGNVAGHVADTVRQVKAIVAGCKFHRIADIQASAVVDFLAGLRRDKNATLHGNKQLFSVADVAGLLGVGSGLGPPHGPPRPLGSLTEPPASCASRAPGRLG